MQLLLKTPLIPSCAQSPVSSCRFSSSYHHNTINNTTVRSQRGVSAIICEHAQRRGADLNAVLDGSAIGIVGSHQSHNRPRRIDHLTLPMRHIALLDTGLEALTPASI